ncbi:hypothetical protein N0V82_009019 [Gnomoniopsis sp. IMI 355080]|nr:hypothetical protein N0V82_009019 [Gnomoniopsis sp. IMI 355080]
MIQTKGTEVPRKHKFEARSPFPRIFQLGRKHRTLSAELDKTSMPVIKDSRGLIADAHMGEEPRLIADTEPGALVPDYFEDEAVSATDGHAGARNQGNAPQDDTARGKPYTDRNLWYDAWCLLPDVDKTVLAKPWKKLNPPNESLRGFRGDENTKRRNKAAAGGRKGTNKADNFQPDYVLRVIKGAKQAQERRPGASSTAIKVVKSVLAFKELGDAVAKFDYSGYASSAWTVVSFGLTLVANTQHRMEEAYKAIGYLAELLNRYQKTETYYRLKIISESQRKPLEDAMVEFYTAILKYSVAVKKVVDGSASDRIIGALKGDELQSLKNTINSKASIMKEWESIVDHESKLIRLARGRSIRFPLTILVAVTDLFQKRTTENLNGIGQQVLEIFGLLGNVQEGVAVTKDNVEFLAGIEVLQWLCPSTDDTGTKRHDNLREDIENLGKHEKPEHSFVENEEYQAWKDNIGANVLWLHAPYLFKPCEKESSQKLVLYWYFDVHTKNMATVYRSFMRQLAHGVSRFPQDIHDWLKATPPSPRWREKLVEWFKALNQHVYVVLDGIDELPKMQLKQSKWQQVDQLISILTDDENPYLHSLLLSKNDDIVRKRLGKLGWKTREIDIKDDLRTDLDRYVARMMDHDDFFKDMSSYLQESIKESLEKNEGRNFLWATSLLDELRGCSSREEISNKLQKVPRAMTKTYQQELGRIEEKDKSEMKQIFMWLLRHKRVEMPLTATEAAAAADLSSSELGRLLEVIKSMVTLSPSDRSLASVGKKIDSSDDSGDDSDDNSDDDSGDDSAHRSGDDMTPRHVEFVHFSANDYLEELMLECGKPGLAGQMLVHWAQELCFSNEEAHHEITKKCLSVLLEKDRPGGGKPRESPLKKYAARHWHEHYLEVAGSPTKARVSELDKLIKELLRPDSDAFKSWLHWYDPDEDHGLSGCESEWNGKHGSALHAAAYYGHSTTVRLLLDADKGAVDQEGGLLKGTALHAAAAQGHIETVQLLLDYKADPTRICGLFGTALQAALAFKSDSATDNSQALREAIENQGFETANRSDVGWHSAFLQLQETSPSLLHRFTSIFLPTDMKRQLRNEKVLPKQRVLHTVIQKWMLPGANDLSRCLESVIKWSYQTPAQEQLEDIGRVLPKFPVNPGKLELNNIDFFYKALFWTGINYILEVSNGSPFPTRSAAPLISCLHSVLLFTQNLEPLIRTMMVSIEDAVPDAGTFAIRDGEALDQHRYYVAAQWRYNRGRRFRSGIYRKYQERMLAEDRDQWWHTLADQPQHRSSYSIFRNVDMDVSDEIVLDLTRQQQMLQKQLINKVQGDGVTDTPGKMRPLSISTRSEDEGELRIDDVSDDGDDKDTDDSDNSDNSDGRDSSNNDSSSNDGDSKMDIHLVVDELLSLVKEMVEFGKQCDRLHRTVASAEDKETIKRLTFEVFAAVARLAVSMGEWEKDVNSTAANDSLGQTKLAAAVSLNELPCLVREEMSPMLDRLRDQMCEQMRDLVRDAVRDELERHREAVEGTSLAPMEQQRSHKWSVFS